VRRIQGERRASGDVVHVELSPGAVTILPAWKLDAVYCAGLKVGLPQVSLAALGALHDLLTACESRSVSPTATSSGRRPRMIAQLRLARWTELARRLEHSFPAAPRQLDLILRIPGMVISRSR
jgi:hypothetical protein